MGGYLSRVSARQVREVKETPMLSAFLALSEDRTLPPADLEALRHGAPAFVDTARLGWVVVHPSRTPRALHDFVLQALALELVASDDDILLYRPGVGTLGPAPAAPCHRGCTAASADARARHHATASRTARLPGMVPPGWFLLVYAASGAAALVYEVAWTRLLTLYLGHGVAAASTVLAAFMGGLAIGAAVAGPASDRLDRRTAMRLYAGLEWPSRSWRCWCRCS